MTPDEIKQLAKALFFEMQQQDEQDNQQGEIDFNSIKSLKKELQESKSKYRNLWSKHQELLRELNKNN